MGLREMLAEMQADLDARQESIAARIQQQFNEIGHKWGISISSVEVDLVETTTMGDTRKKWSVGKVVFRADL